MKSTGGAWALKQLAYLVVSVVSVIWGMNLANKINREQARTIARTECQTRGMACDEPLRVSWGPFSYTVWTNAHSRGGNVIVRLRRRDGAVLRVSVTPM